MHTWHWLTRDAISRNSQIMLKGYMYTTCTQRRLPGIAPMVGTVLKISPMCSLYSIVVFPAASSPSMTTCQEAHQRLFINVTR